MTVKPFAPFFVKHGKGKVDNMKKTLKEPLNNSMTIIRIAPVCKGRIYIVPHQTSQEGSCLLDIPIQEQVTTTQPPTSRSILKLKERYHSHIKTSEQPRFCVRHRMQSKRQDIIYLYILPLQNEEDIHFSQGKFISFEEILADHQSFSPYLQEESALLEMSAELWNDFYTGTNNI